LAREGFGIPLPEQKIRPRWPKAALTEADSLELFQKHKIQSQTGFIALAPGAAYGPAKRWPLHYWRELIQKISEARKESLLILGGKEEEAYLRELWEGVPGERPPQRVFSLVGATSALDLGRVLSKCSLLVTNDTGPMHAAAAAGTPVLALFGSTSPDWTRPFGSGHRVIYKQVECSPCFQKTCPIGYKCLTAITVGEVFQGLLEILEKPPKIFGENPPPSFLKADPA
jgi:heptosyltransferase-2